MSNGKPEQLSFHPVNGLTVRADFDGGALSSDFGTLLLREVDQQCGLLPRMAGAIRDTRHASYVEHPMRSLLAQRVFQMACGYEDGNDSNTLRHDPMFKLAVGHAPMDGPALAHGSTFTRLEQALSGKDIYRLTEALIEHFVSSYAKPPQVIVLDLDHTEHAVYGQQQLALFHGHYGSYCYLPLLIFEGLSGKLVGAFLRPGKTPTGHENAAILRRVLARLRAHWPTTHVVVRGDMHFSQPELMHLVQADPHADFVFGLGAGNPQTLRPKAAQLLQTARQTLAVARADALTHHQTEPDRIRLYDEVSYVAGSWKGLDCRVIVKAEVSSRGDNPRFVVTSIKAACPEVVYRDFYCARGQDENYIKHLKNDLAADRMSSQGFVANGMRLLYACAAYVLIHTLRTETLRDTPLAAAQPSTLIAKLFKIAVRVVQYKDRVKLHLPMACPVKSILIRITDLIYATPLPKPG